MAWTGFEPLNTSLARAYEPLGAHRAFARVVETQRPFETTSLADRVGRIRVAPNLSQMVSRIGPGLSQTYFANIQAQINASVGAINAAPDEGAVACDR